MSTVTSLLRQRLLDLLEDRRVVVWYDPPGHFREFMREIRPDGSYRDCRSDLRWSRGRRYRAAARVGHSSSPVG